MKKVNISKLSFTDSFDHQKSVIFTEDDFGAPVRTQVLLVKPGQTIPPHHHNLRTEAFMILEGNGQIAVSDEVVSDKQSMIICKPGDIHSMRNLSDAEPFKILIIRTNESGKEDMIWEEK